MPKFVLATNVPYTRFHGGANRSNRALVEALAARGHRVRVVTPALASPPTQDYAAWRQERLEEGADLAPDPYGARFVSRGVEVLAVEDTARVRAALGDTLAADPPDWVLVASEDPSQSLLAAALEAVPERVAYLALTPQLFPFGPESLYPGAERTELVRRCRLRLALSQATVDYVARWGGMSCALYTPPHFGAGPFPELADPAGPALLINASAIKGLPIFLELATAFPDRPFAALPGYATTAGERAALEAAPNVELRTNRPSLDEVFAGVSVALMPSLWFESFGLVAVDAMLRGVPVLAADHGALPEALLGTRAPLPVRPIEGYRDSLQDNLLLEPIVPPQDAAPWRRALADLWSDPAAYRATSRAVRQTALDFVRDLSVAPFERLLAEAAARTPATDIRTDEPKKAEAPEETGALSPAQKAQMLRRLKARKTAGETPAGKPGIPRVARVARAGDLPLSPGQRRLYFLQRLDPESPVYNTAVALRLRGPLDEAALRAALDGLLARHEALRTAVVEIEGEPRARIAPPMPFPLAVDNLAAGESLSDALKRHAAQPFDLSRAPLARGRLLRSAPNEAVLLLTIHHLATDAWSAGLLMRDLAGLYGAAANGTRAALPEPALGFADYAAWQAGDEGSHLAKAHEDRWVERLRGAPTAIQLPSDRPRPAVRRNLGDSLPVTLAPDLAEAVRARAQAAGATPFMLLLAAWAALLHRVGGDEDMVIGIPVANRGRAETEEVVGFFVNTLPLRLDLSGNPSFSDLLAQVRERLLDGFQHQEAAFERIVERLELPRSRSHAPLVQTLFGLHSAPGAMPELPGLQVEAVPLHNGSAKFDLNLELAETDGGLDGSLEFDTEMFEPDTVERLFGAWEKLLRGVCAQPEAAIGSLPLVSDAEAAALVAHSGGGPALRAEGDSLPRRLRAVAAATPEAPALQFGATTMSHAEADARSEEIAAALAGRGVTFDTPVAFAVARGFGRTLAMLGILKAGGACLPLDLALPDERLRRIAQASGAPFVVADETTASRAAGLGLPVVTLDELAAGPKGAPPATIPPEATAYLLYTSGSTGEPKGVAYPHGAELNLMLWGLERLPEPARALQFASAGFDASFNESLSTLMAGGCLVLLSEAERADIQRVLDIYLEREIERAVMPVVVLHLLAERILARPPERLALREILATGEQLKITPAVAELLRRYPALRLFNDYGPTESNVITALEVTRRADHYGALPPIGRAVAGCHCYILDRYLQPLPAGMPGELYLAGEGLARGYAGRPGFTAERFLPDPLSEVPGARMYRSGDLARLRRDGELELLGRSDDQLKIRGFRVEPAEVEIALRRHPRVRDCLVLGRDFPGEDRRLVAYVIPAEGAAPDAAELQAHLGEGLPGYMVPAHVVTLERFPLNANGKIDRTALPMPEIGARSEARQGPRTDLEAAILAIWAEVLETPDIDIRDDFFSLGGHSLLIIRIIARLREELNVQVPLADFMDAPTVEQLAVTVTAHLAESGDADELAGLLDELEAGETPAAETAAPQVLDARVVLAAMRTHGAEAEGPAPVAVLGVPSSNRPDSLAACLKSYLANAQAFGHAPELVVCGTQRDAATEAAYRGRLSEIEERFGASVLYAGEAEKLRFAQTLAQAAGVDPSVVRFALADTEQAGLPYGTNRNALLLHNAGRAFVSVDDDTRADLYILPGPRNGYEVVGEPGVSEIRVLADRAAALAEVEAARFDWLGSHAAMLGAEAAYLLREANDLDTDRASAGPLACLAEGRGRVAASYHGWVGDSGWANPEDARWLAGASLEWITATPERYATALASREAVRGVHGPTLGRGGDFFCLSAGFDARRPLVPFLPVQRREDALFGWLATRADPELLAAHLPGLVLHDRQTGSPAPTATREAVDLAMLVQAALADIGGLPSDAADRLQALGAGLQAACAQTPDDFDAWLRGAVEAQQARDFAEVEARLAAWPAERAYWAHDAEVALQMARRRASAPDAHLPLRLGGTDRTARLAKTRHLLDLFGRLTEAWPTLMREAAELREDGRGLAQPAGLATLAS